MKSTSVFIGECPEPSTLRTFRVPEAFLRYALSAYNCRTANNCQEANRSKTLDAALKFNWLEIFNCWCTPTQMSVLQCRITILLINLIRCYDIIFSPSFFDFRNQGRFCQDIYISLSSNCYYRIILKFIQLILVYIFMHYS